MTTCLRCGKKKRNSTGYTGYCHADNSVLCIFLDPIKEEPKNGHEDLERAIFAKIAKGEKNEVFIHEGAVQQLHDIARCTCGAYKKTSSSPNTK